MLKYKMIVLCVILLFSGISISPIIAHELPEEELKEDAFIIEYGLISLGGSATTAKITLSNQEVTELTSTLSEFAEKAESISSYNEFRDIIKSLGFPFKHPILFKILNYISCYNLPRSRSLVVSFGWNYKLNPFRNSRVELYKPINFWRYSCQSGLTLEAKTFMLRLVPFNTKILHGMQIGMMTNFFGIYIYVSQPPPQKSFAFFMGSARHVFGMDFLCNI